MGKVKLRKKISVIQIGSTIQQNFGENVKNHGYGVYEIDKDQYDFVDLPNPKPFLSFRMNSFDCIEKGTEKLVNNG